MYCVTHYTWTHSPIGWNTNSTGSLKSPHPLAVLALILTAWVLPMWSLILLIVKLLVVPLCCGTFNLTPSTVYLISYLVISPTYGTGSLQTRKAKENLGRITRKLGGAGTEKCAWLKSIHLCHESHMQMNTTCTI